MHKLKFIFVLLFFFSFLIPGSKVLAYDGNAYTDSNGVIYTEYSGKYTVTGYNGTSNKIIIPEVVNGMVVDKIGPRAFQNKTIISIDLPGTISSIDNNAFNNCCVLGSIEIPNGVTSIGDYAFEGCSALTSITIPDSVTSIGSYAFHNCIKIKNIAIPNSVTSIGAWAFYGCSSLSSITMLDGIKSIPNGAFADCNSLTGITIPSSVTDIGYSAFLNCTSLANITIPGSVTSIGNGAFMNCSSITSIIIPKGVTNIHDQVFRGCSNLSSITISDSVTNLGNYTFENCSSLSSITIPGSVTSIGEYEFASCSGLKNIVMPNGIKSIGSGAFDNCINLSGITIPDGVTNIGSYAFWGCSNLTSIIMPGGVANIGEHAFQNCSSLTSVTMSNSITRIDDSVFSSCSSLTDITIPDGVTSIGAASFWGCSSLTSITLPGSVTSIGRAAFASCYNLSSITIPISVTSIADLAFLSCNLSNLKISGYTNSYADIYAAANGYKFEPLGDAYDQIFTVKFNTNCETMIPDMSVNFSSSLTDIPELMKDGWELDGWFTDPTFSTHFDKVNGDMTLYAKWIASINFDSQGGTTIDPMQITAPGKISKPNDPDRTGYTFGGWYKEASCLNTWDFSSDEITKCTTLYAKWIVNTYAVSFESDGGSPVDNINVQYNNLVTPPEAPVREGYTFSGWYKDLNCTLPWNFETGIVKYDFTLYAKWTINYYDVNFNSKGGSSAENQSIIYSGKALRPEEPTRTGYTFGGWYTDDSTFEHSFDFINTPITADITLYVKWTINSYKVYFNPNGGSSTVVQSVDYNGKALKPVDPNRAAYTFNGWYIDNGIFMNLFDFENTPITQAITLNAKWTAKPVTEVKLDKTEAVLKAGEYLNLTAIVNPEDALNKNVTWSSSNTSAATVDSTGKVTAVDSGTALIAATTDDGEYKSSCSITVIQAPAVPIGLQAASIGYDSIKISWASVAEANGYEIYRANSYTGNYSKVSTATSESFTDTGLMSGTAYYYKVMAYKTAETVNAYGNYSSVISAKPIIAAPISVKAVSYSYSSINISWGAVSGANGYEVYRSASSTGTYSSAGSTAYTNYINTGLVTNSTYYYKIKAYRLVGATKVYSEDSTAASAKPILPVPVSVKAVSSGYNSINISWSAVGGASGYQIYRSTSGTGAYALVATTVYPNYNNIGLTTNSTYYYKIRAYRLLGATKVYSGDSTAASAKPIPSIPANFKAVRYNSRSIKLTWSGVSGASGYEIYRSTSSTGTYSLVKSTNYLYYVNSSLVTGRYYYYKIRAYRIVRTTKIYSNWTVVKYARP